jgi:hypothetical protein
VEDEEAYNEEPLIDKLTPTLHGEREDDISAAVHTIFDCCLVTVVSFHCASTGHWIFATNSKGIEHQGKSVQDDPAFQRFSPHRRKQNGTDKHDDNILDQTPPTSNPITNEADADLAEDNTDDFEVTDRGDPVLRADFVGFPARWPNGLEEGRKIADGEESITFDEHTHTGNDIRAEEVADRLERVLLKLGHKEEELAMGFGIRLLIDPIDALFERQVGPVGCAVVHVGGEEFVFEEIIGVVRFGCRIPLLHAGEVGNFIYAFFSVRRHCCLSLLPILEILKCGNGVFICTFAFSDYLRMCLASPSRWWGPIDIGAAKLLHKIFK